MNVAKNICPVCKETNELEAVFCKHCGAVLEDPFMDSGTGTKTTNMSAVAPENIGDWSINKAAVPEHGIAVYIDGEFNPTYQDSKAEFVIGRKAETSSLASEAFLDLAPRGGYARGISRRHAVIKRTERGYEILDLGSSNGTWLEDKKLVPNKSYPLASGSHLRLGSMRLFVLYHPKQES